MPLSQPSQEWLMSGSAEKFGAGMAWAFAIGGGIVAALVGMYVPGIIGWLLNVAVLLAAGWATVYMTQATTGKGILAFLVGGIVSGVVGYFLLKSAVSAATSGAGDAMQE